MISVGRRALPPVAAALGVAGAALALHVWNPGDGGPVLCPFRFMTGIDCPMCGATRSAISLTYGDVSAAIDHNALFVVLLLPAAAIAWLIWLREGLNGRPAPEPPRWLAPVVGGVLMVWWVFRLLVPYFGSGLS